MAAVGKPSTNIYVTGANPWTRLSPVKTPKRDALREQTFITRRQPVSSSDIYSMTLADKLKISAQYPNDLMVVAKKIADDIMISKNTSNAESKKLLHERISTYLAYSKLFLHVLTDKSLIIPKECSLDSFLLRFPNRFDYDSNEHVLRLKSSESSLTETERSALESLLPIKYHNSLNYFYADSQAENTNLPKEAVNYFIIISNNIMQLGINLGIINPDTINTDVDRKYINYCDLLTNFWETVQSRVVEISNYTNTNTSNSEIETALKGLYDTIDEYSKQMPYGAIPTTSYQLKIVAQ